MGNIPVDAAHTASNKLMLVFAVVLALFGIVGFYKLAGQGVWIRAASLIGGLVIGGVFALFSPAGKSFISFAKDSWREVCKVVWPTRKEAGQMTLIVFVFVLIMASYLWLTDKTIEWAVFSLILGWK